MANTVEREGPDLVANGVATSELKEGEPLLGEASGEPVLLVRRGAELFAVGAKCTHYGGPLGDGLVVGDSIHCPWHHARFNLRTGAPTAPALEPISCWRVESRDAHVHVVSKREIAANPILDDRSSIVIVGGGAAGHSAIETLRREGFDGKITLLTADTVLPCDRPKLSKEYLAGTENDDWLPLRPCEFYDENRVEVALGARVDRLDLPGRRAVLESGAWHPFDALLLATGAEPIRLHVPGAELPHVRYLRTVDDSRAIVARLSSTTRAVVVGAGFIALEVAASLRTRGLEVHVVAPDARPLERVLGPEVGDFLRALHEQHGVVFHLGSAVASIASDSVVLATGERLSADLVVVGIGVRPAIELAERAGLTVDRGVVVDEYLETSAHGIYAAGDIARWPDRATGESIRVEHWVVAQRHGALAARNMLGSRLRCALVPFFWSQHYDLGISYVGHAETWDRIDRDGDLHRRDCTLAFRSGTRTLAVVTIGRDGQSLTAESAYECEDFDALSAIATKAAPARHRRAQ
jgi:NADPH-dependent 2,4-dienoyl-CoA reductase/sulfur reductase-like enzyme/nitrite reductase/ring-hydroxylating ferredoxin subunit